MLQNTRETFQLGDGGCACAPALLRQRVHALLQPQRFLRQVLAGGILGRLLTLKETSETREGSGEHRGMNDLQLQDAGGQPPVLLP